MADDEFTGVSTAGCEAESWSPEVISIYGDPDTVIQKFSGFEMNLPRRRVYMFTIESKEYAEIAFYERTGRDRVSVSRWRGKPTSDFHESVSRAIIDNKGVHCVGEQTKAIVSRLPNLTNEGEVAAPVNAKAAFSHAVRARGSEYIKTTAYLMC